MRMYFNEKPKIYGIGTAQSLAAAKAMLDNLPLTSGEKENRILIQDALDRPEYADAAKCRILYDGNGIVQREKIVKEFKRMLRSGTLERMSNRFYEFCTCTLSDIAHYNKEGYIEFYNNDPWALVMEFFLPEQKRIPCWRSDAKRVLEDLLAAAGL